MCFALNTPLFLLDATGNRSVAMGIGHGFEKWEYSKSMVYSMAQYPLVFSTNLSQNRAVATSSSHPSHS